MWKQWLWLGTGLSSKEEIKLPDELDWLGKDGKMNHCHIMWYMFSLQYVLILITFELNNVIYSVDWANIGAYINISHPS